LELSNDAVKRSTLRASLRFRLLARYVFDRLVFQTKADHETFPLCDIAFLYLCHLLSLAGMDANAAHTCDPGRQSWNVNW
jgi:hypothetical protein